MAFTLTADGFTDGSTFTQSTAPFMYNHTDTAGTGIGSSNVELMTTPDWKTPPKAVGQVWIYLPQRNDSGSWGGHHITMYYRINSGSWVSMGQSGYSQTDTTMSYPNSGRIDTQCQSWGFDFSSITTNFTVAFRLDGYYHNGNGAYLSSCSTTSSGNSTYTFNYDSDGGRSANGGNYSCGHIAWFGQGQ